MTWNRTIITGVVLVAVLLLAALDRQIIVNRIYEAVNSRSLAPSVDASAVTEIRISNSQGETVLTKGADKQWRLKAPFEAPADPEIVEALLVNVTAANRTNEIDPPALAEYGLAKPDTRVTFLHGSKDGKEKEFSLLLGNESTYTGLVFAKYPETRKVFTVGQHVKASLSRGPRDYRRARLFDIDTGDLDSYKTISLKGRDSEIVLKNEAGKWRITQPFESFAEPEIVREYLRKVGLLRASGFLSDTTDRPTSATAALAALSSPSLTATFERAGEKTPQVLTLATAEGSAGPVVVAQRSGGEELFAVRSETLDDLRQDAHFFRSREIFSMTPKDAGGFKIRIGHALTDLVRNDKGLWEISGEPNRKVDQQEVEGRLEALLKSRVRKFVDPKPVDPGNYGIPRFSFTVTAKDGSRVEILETGSFEKGDPTNAYARRSGDPAIFTTEISKDMVITPDLVTDRHFARVNAAAAKRMDFEAGGKSYTFKSDDGEWKMERPDKPGAATVDKRKVERFLELLNSLTYERDLSATGDTVITPPAESPLTVRIFAEDDKPAVEFTTGRRAGDRTYISVKPGRTIEIGTPTVERLVNAVNTLVSI